MKRLSRRQPASEKRANAVRDLARLEDIPNVGHSIAADLRQLGIKLSGEMVGRDPYALYEDLCRLTGQRHDPCSVVSNKLVHGLPQLVLGDLRKSQH